MPPMAEPGAWVRIDTPAAVAALLRLEPVIAEVESALDEVADIAEQVRGQCAAHPSGAVFDVGHGQMAEASTRALEELRRALSGYADDVRLAVAHLGRADTENAVSLRPPGSDRC